LFIIKYTKEQAHANQNKTTDTTRTQRQIQSRK